MSTKIIAAPLPRLSDTPPLFRALTRALCGLMRRCVPNTSPAPRVLAVEDRIVIGPKKALVVVRCHRQRFLVGTCGESIGPVIEVSGPKAARKSRGERNA